MPRERLHKILAKAGLGSRRGCETLISEGRVAVNGKSVTKLGSTADAETDKITVDGTVACIQEPVVYVLNKPKGFVCTNAKAQADRLAVDLIDDERRLYSAGRLDQDSEGLLIVTNDGELTKLLTHPRHEVEKEYFVEVRGRVDDASLAKLRGGIRLSEGKATAKSVSLDKRGLKIVLETGMNRQIRRMLAAVGFKTRRLERRRIGFLRLGSLKSGAYRKLSEQEIRRLKRDAERGGAPKRRKKS